MQEMNMCGWCKKWICVAHGLLLCTSYHSPTYTSRNVPNVHSLPVLRLLQMRKHCWVFQFLTVKASTPGTISHFLSTRWWFSCQWESWGPQALCHTGFDEQLQQLVNSEELHLSSAVRFNAHDQPSQTLFRCIKEVIRFFFSASVVHSCQWESIVKKPNSCWA